MDNEQQVKTAGWISLVLGLWLIASPFVLGFSGTSLSQNNVIFGIIIAILAFFQISMPSESSWSGWLNALLGLWILVAPFILGFATLASLWNGIIAGVIVAGAAIWAASSSSSAEHPKAV